MAGSINKVILVGRVGKDPEIRRTQQGNAIVSFSLATSETWRDKQTGERKEKTEWSNVVIFNEGLTKVAEAYVKKGSLIYLEGQLQTRKWQDKDGNDRYTTEVVLPAFRGALTLLDSKDDGDKRGDPAVLYQGPAKGGTGQQSLADALDDSIPFAPQVL